MNNRDPVRRAEQVLDMMTKALPGMSPALRRAAGYVIEHPRDIGANSMRTMAARAAIHPNTFVRLAQHIGFSGYDDMRETFRNFVVADQIGGFRDRAAWLTKLSREGGSPTVVGQMAEAILENTERCFRESNAKALMKVSDMFLEAGQVHVIGLGAAYSLAHQLWYVTRMAFGKVRMAPQPGFQLTDDLALLGPGDLLIAMTFQPYRTETLRAVRRARSREAAIVGVTDSRLSPLLPLCDRCLICPTSTPQFFQSHAAAVAMLETLTALIVSKAPEATRERIHRLHEGKLEAGSYEDAGETGPAPIPQRTGRDAP